VQRATIEPAARATPVFTDLVGSVSVRSEQEHGMKQDVYYNLDGHRIDDGRFTSFAKDVQKLIPGSRIFTDPLRTFAYGTDASFYRLNPKMVIKVHSEEEMIRLLPLARKHDVPVTFRAAGTSLSGQALTDSVLLKISHTGKNFRNFEVHVRSFPCPNLNSLSPSCTSNCGSAGASVAALLLSQTPRCTKQGLGVQERA
jgi:D-lactate dehydrogenase